jgi:hypothetical protein
MAPLMLPGLGHVPLHPDMDGIGQSPNNLLKGVKKVI